MSLPPPLKVGDLVANKYRLLARIGEGGYGFVWRAHHESMGRDVALKTMRPEAAQRPEEVERFRREVFNASCLHHPNTITLHDYGQAQDGSLFIVMEYLKGMNLAQWLKKNGPLSHELALDVLEQTLRSLREAHHHNILHRDLKPENLFLVDIEEGEERLVKVLDFGLSKALGGQRRPYQRTLTKEGQVYGTPQYMSPEQACAMKLSPASDIYALGLLCWEMLTGRPAFAGATPVDILLKQVNEPVPDLPLLLKGELLDQFIRRATRKDQQERFSSAREALEWLLQGKEQARTAAAPTQPQPPQQLPPPPPAFAPPREPATLEEPPPPLDALPAPQPPPLSVEPWFSHRELDALDLHELDLRLAQLPMVGRQQELHELLRWGQQALVTGGVLWITGELGVGKTRLIDEWLRHMEMHSVTLLRARYPESGATLCGAREALSPLLASPGAELGAPLLEQPLRDELQLALDALDQRRPSAQALERALPAMEQALYALAKTRPTLLVLEDLQWADAATMRLVERWKEALTVRALPLVLVCARRSASPEAPRRALHSRFAHIKTMGAHSFTHAYDLHLSPLCDEDAASLLEDLLPFRPLLATRLVHTARGNPLFLTQIVRYLFEQRLITRDGEGLWQLEEPSSQGHPGSLLPPELERLLIARIRAQIDGHRLSSILDAVLVRAMVLGERFEARLLKAVLRAERREDLEAYLDDAIEVFTQAGVLIPTSVQGRLGFEFGYEMLRAGLLGTGRWPEEELHALHALVARAKLAYATQRDPEWAETLAPEIAAHWERAGERERALKWLMRAAKHAEKVQDFRGALAHLRQLDGRLDDELDPSGELWLEIRLAQGRMFRFLGEFGPAREALEEAVEETRRVGDVVGEALTGEALASLHVLMTEYGAARQMYQHVSSLYHTFGERAGELRCELGLAELDRFSGDYASATARFGAVYNAAERLEDQRGLLARSLHGQGQCAYARGALEEAAQLFRRARKLSETLNDALMMSEADIELAMLSMTTEHIEQAISTVKLAMETKRQIGDSLGLAHGHLVLGMCLRRTQRIEEAQRHAAKARKLNERLAHRYGLAKSLLLEAEICWARGRLDDALRHAEASDTLHDQIGDVHGTILVTLHMALCLLERGEVSRADDALRQLDVAITRHELELYRPKYLTFLGMIRERQGDLEGASALHAEAIEVATRQGNMELMALATTNLAKTHLMLGDLVAAREDAPQAMSRAEATGHVHMMMFALAINALIARHDRRTEALTSVLRRLRVLHENAAALDLRIPHRLDEMARTVRAHVSPERAFGLVLAIVETLRAIGANANADAIAQDLMKRG